VAATTCYVQLQWQTIWGNKWVVQAVFCGLEHMLMFANLPDVEVNVCICIVGETAHKQVPSLRARPGRGRAETQAWAARVALQQGPLFVRIEVDVCGPFPNAPCLQT